MKGKMKNLLILGSLILCLGALAETTNNPAYLVTADAGGLVLALYDVNMQGVPVTSTNWHSEYLDLTWTCSNSNALAINSVGINCWVKPAPGMTGGTGTITASGQTRFVTPTSNPPFQPFSTSTVVMLVDSNTPVAHVALPVGTGTWTIKKLQ